MRTQPRLRPKRLGEKLRAIRENENLSQTQKAEILSNEAISLRKTDISKYELDQRQPNLIVLLRYARTSGVNVENLIDDELEITSPLPKK